VLRALATDVWVVERPQRFLGIELGTRMTVARVDGGLWVCSPVSLDDELRRAIDALGEVRWIVAPNRFHHLYVAPFAAAYPKARLFGPPGLGRKRKDLRFDAVLRDGVEAGWGDDLGWVRLRGVPIFDELVFVHRPSATLVVTDFLMAQLPNGGAVPRLTMRLEGVHRQPGVPRTVRLLALRDREALGASLRPLRDWPVERIVLAHGALVERDGRSVLRRAFGWLEH
jgi:hypothetical protein